MPDAAVTNAIVDSFDFRSGQALEREIETAAHHAKVVFRAIYHVPAEVVDPADMRSDADFDAPAELADLLCLGFGCLSPDTPVTCHKTCRLPAAKDAAATSKNVWRKTAAGDRVTK